jgi:chromosomal replication initiator protein
MRVIMEIEYNATEWTVIWLFKILNSIGIKPKIFKIERKDTDEKTPEISNTIFYSIVYIKNIICTVTQTPVDVFESSSRKQEIAENRQIAMYFCRKYTRKSLREIGMEFGNKTPATILHACKTIQNLIHTDKKFQYKLEEIENAILNR